MELEVCVVLGCLILLILLSLSAPKKKPKEEEKCKFCREGTVLIAYRENESGDRKVAAYCPVCGRKIGGE